jgi:hypothetical protein
VRCRGWLLALAPLLLAAASGSAAAQVDVDGTDRQRTGAPGLWLAGPMEAPRLPRIDMALLSPLAAPSADPAQLARQAQGIAPNSPLNLGLQWRRQPAGGFSVQATVWRRISLDARPAGAPAEPIYGAQLEMELRRDPRASLRDLLGMQLNNGGRISLKPRRNEVTIYYKVSF